MNEYEYENEIAALELERDELRKLVKMGEAVVEDFMPNVGRCVLKDYRRLNTFLVKAAKIKAPS